MRAVDQRPELSFFSVLADRLDLAPGAWPSVSAAFFCSLRNRLELLLALVQRIHRPDWGERGRKRSEQKGSKKERNSQQGCRRRETESVGPVSKALMGRLT